jgi:hypothetical protein
MTVEGHGYTQRNAFEPTEYTFGGVGFSGDGRRALLSYEAWTAEGPEEGPDDLPKGSFGAFVEIRWGFAILQRADDGWRIVSRSGEWFLVN